MSIAPRLVSTAVVTPKQTVRPLHDRHRTHLQEGSGISPEIIAERGYFTVSNATQISHMSDRQQRLFPAIGFPVYQLGEPKTVLTRPDTPYIETREDGKVKPIKYEWPAYTPLVLDMLPRYRHALQNPSIPLCITEGIKKTDAASSQPWGNNAVWISINGVWGWMDGKDADGNRCLLPDYRKIPLRGRHVILIPDSDYETNPHVKMAFDEHAKALVARGAEVGIVRFPHSDKKMGLDDAIVNGWSWADIEQAIHPCDGPSAHADQLEANAVQRLQHEIERLQAYIQEIEATIANKELTPGERLTLYHLNKELRAQRRQQPQPEQQAPVLTRVWKIAEESGQKESAVGRHLRKFEDYGVIQRDIRRHHDSCTKQVKAELYVVPSPALDRPFHIKPNKPRNWGGRVDRCAECGSHNLVEHVTVACEDCGAIHKTTRRRLQPPIIQNEGSSELFDDTSSHDVDAPTVQDETSENTDEEGDNPHNVSTPITYIDHFDGSGKQASVCDPSPTLQDERSEEAPRLELRIARPSPHRFFINQAKIDFVLNVKLQRDGPEETRNFMERVEGWSRWPDHVRRAVERAEQQGITT